MFGFIVFFQHSYVNILDRFSGSSGIVLGFSWIFNTHK